MSKRIISNLIISHPACDCDDLALVLSLARSTRRTARPALLNILRRLSRS